MTSSRPRPSARTVSALAALSLCALSLPARAQERGAVGPATPALERVGGSSLAPAFPSGVALVARPVSTLDAPVREVLPTERVRLLLAAGVALDAPSRATAPDIVRYVYAHRRHLRACAEPPVRRARRHEERIEISLEIQPSGAVSRARVDASPGALVEPICVAAVLTQLRFPPPGEVLSLRFPVDCTDHPGGSRTRPRRRPRPRT